MKKVLLIVMMILLLGVDSGCSLSSRIPLNNPSAIEDNPSTNNPNQQSTASGNSPTISPSESDNHLVNLQKQGLKVIDEQSFWIELENWGRVHFVAGEMQINGLSKLSFYVIDSEDNVLCGLPEFYGNMWILYGISAISFKDANKDGLKDIIVVADYILGHGENAAVPFPVGGIYFQKNDEFISIPELDKEINGEKQNESIDMILKFVEGKDISPNQTMNVGSKDDLNTIIGILNEEHEDMRNKDLTHDERVEVTIKFTENLAEFLRIKESTKLNDEDLQKALNYHIVAKTNVQNIDGISVRIVRFDGLPVLLGTLERKWTYIQWWTDIEVHSQIIISKGAEVTVDYLFSRVKGIPTVILSGYRTIYKPYPVFLATWQLKDGEWKEVNLFNNNMVSDEIWSIEVSEKYMTIISKNKDEQLTVGLNQQKDGFEVYSEADQNKKLEFKLQGEQIVLQ